MYNVPLRHVNETTVAVQKLQVLHVSLCVCVCVHARVHMHGCGSVLACMYPYLSSMPCTGAILSAASDSTTFFDVTP
jgi:hypothetical protein